MPPYLIADIGGTNARFCLLNQSGEIESKATFLTADFPNPTAAIQSFLEGKNTRPYDAALAIACPILPHQDRVVMTNAAWDFSITETRHNLGLKSLRVINDFVAAALSIPHLTSADTLLIKNGTPQPHTPILAIGPGTGLGIALMIPQENGEWLPIGTEGGHATLCGVNQEENAIIAALQQKFGHVSIERVLSGSGLTLLYEILRKEKYDHLPTSLTPRLITQRAIEEQCPLCQKTLNSFFAFLGTMVGNMTLSTGALGGVYLMGGILPRVANALQNSTFINQFMAKGRFQSYLKTVPLHLVTHPNPAFLGLSMWAKKE